MTPTMSNAIATPTSCATMNIAICSGDRVTISRAMLISTMITRIERAKNARSP